MGTYTVTGASAGTPTGQKIIGPITFTGTTAGIGSTNDVTLVSGDNTITVPTGASGVVITLGSGPAATVQIRTNLDTGTGCSMAPYSGTGAIAFPITTGVTSLILKSSTTQAGVEVSFI